MGVHHGLAQLVGGRTGIPHGLPTPSSCRTRCASTPTSPPTSAAHRRCPQRPMTRLGAASSGRAARSPTRLAIATSTRRLDGSPHVTIVPGGPGECGRSASRRARAILTTPAASRVASRRFDGSCSLRSPIGASAPGRRIAPPVDMFVAVSASLRSTIAYPSARPQWGRS
jgi:hypothetical protein